MARITAIINQKGGVGKTNCTVNIGAALSHAGKKVLLVDIDSQGDLSKSIGIKTKHLQHTTYELLLGECSVNDVIVRSNAGYDVIPADLRLSGADMELAGEPGRDTLLKMAIDPIVKNYDYILIDCPPNLALMAYNGLTTAQEILIPIQTEYLAFDGMAQLLKTIQKIKSRINPELVITGIIPTMYDGRKNLNKVILEKMKKYFPNQVFMTAIRENVSLAESPSTGKDIFQYKPDSNGAKDYTELALEIIQQEVKRYGSEDYIKISAEIVQEETKEVI